MICGVGTPILWNGTDAAGNPLRWNTPGLTWNGNLPDERKSMPYGNISAQVADADVAAIKAAVATIRTKLPFLISLSAEDRKRTFKLGPDSLSFVENCLQAAKNNPTVIPGTFDVVEFGSDVDLFAVLTDLNTVIAQLASDTDDTRLAVGGETMQEGTKVYNYVKAAVASTPGLKPVADQLGARFAKSKATAAPATTTPHA